MKLFILSLLGLLSTSCTSMAISSDVNSDDVNLGVSSGVDKSTALVVEKTELENLNKAIALAVKNKDYRLLVTSGRSMSVPGIKASDYQTMIELCGKKYSSGTGDVITSENQRLERKKLVNYMRQYNEQMLILCQENSIR